MEEERAARHAGYTWEQYQRLPGAEWWVDPQNPTSSKAMVIAVYRLDNLIQAVQSDPPPPKGKGRKGR